jgi:hypothetical protein
MRSLTVEAKSLDSARGLYEALAAFEPKLTRSEQKGFQVTVELGTDRQMIAVLDEIERHVSERQAGPARVELDGRNYTLNPS